MTNDKGQMTNVRGEKDMEKRIWTEDMEKQIWIWI